MQQSAFQADLTNITRFTTLNNTMSERSKKRLLHKGASQPDLWRSNAGSDEQPSLHPVTVLDAQALAQPSLFHDYATPVKTSIVGDVPTIDQYLSRFPWFSPELQRKQKLVDQAQDIIQEALDQYDPSHVFILMSGGNDSLASTLVATEVMRRQQTIPWYVVHINTGIGVERTRQFVRTFAREVMAWPFLEYQTKESYDQAVVENGFPGAPAHRYMYTLLKERPLLQLIRDHTPDTRLDEYRWNRRDRDGKREHWPPKVVFISGARKEESRRRMGHVEPIQREKRRIWVAPLTEWTKQDVFNYLAPFQGSIPHNPVPDILHYSGECLCGAFAEKGELALLQVFFPDEYERITRLTEDVKANGFPWEWDEEPPESFYESRKGQMAFDGFEGYAHLCSSCDFRSSRRKSSSEERQVEQ